MKLFTSAALAAAFALTLGGCAQTGAPKAALDAAEAPAEAAAVPAKPDIVATAASAGSFGTLLALAEAAGMVDALKAEGPLTVFAPSDAAFAALPAELVANLKKPENAGQLRAVLSYHVVPGRVAAADLAGKSETPATLQGKTLTVAAAGGGVAIGGANVTQADIEAGNGVIHVIDKVLIPSK